LLLVCSAFLLFCLIPVCRFALLLFLLFRLPLFISFIARSALLPGFMPL
jgi:hypothetical protein